MQILFLNADGGGFADHIDVEDGMTVSALFEQKMKHSSPQDFLIRVNRQPCSRTQVLHEGDRISFTPRKIEGAV